MANENYKCVFIGALRNSTTLSFLCKNLSSTEGPGVEPGGSKGNGHQAQIKVSSVASQHEHFSVKHFLSAEGLHCRAGKKGSPCRGKLSLLWWRRVAETAIVTFSEFVLDDM